MNREQVGRIAFPMPFSNVRIFPGEHSLLQHLRRTHPFARGHGEVLANFPLVRLGEKFALCELSGPCRQCTVSPNN